MGGRKQRNFRKFEVVSLITSQVGRSESYLDRNNWVSGEIHHHILVPMEILEWVPFIFYFITMTVLYQIHVVNELLVRYFDRRVLAVYKQS